LAPPAGRNRPPFRLLAISRFAAAPTAPAIPPITPPTSISLAAAKAWFGALARAGVDGVQLREKNLDDRTLLALARAARAALTGPFLLAAAPGRPPVPARLLVNGRADIALAAGAHGVHLPADGLPAAALRARWGPGLLLGVSTHSLAEVEQARRAGADYAVFGPVWETPGKTAATPPAGLDALARAARLGIPVYALGGVTLARFAAVAAAGAAGVAAIRLFQGEETPLEQIVEAARAVFREPRREAL
jgi:thiamine-phosphate pyrophosphorylase